MKYKALKKVPWIKEDLRRFLNPADINPPHKVYCYVTMNFMLFFI